MTLTEAPQTTVAMSAETEPETGLYAIVTTSDHKTVGKLYMGFSLLFAFSAVVVGALAAFEGADIETFDLFSGADGVAQATNYLWVVGVLGGAIPFLLGLATMVVPLQVGATAIAFPRAAAAGFWAWLIGCELLVLGFALDGGLGGGAAATDSQAVALTVAALVLLMIGLLLGLITIVTSVIALRPEGMSLGAVPMFSWSMVVAAVVWLASMPVLLANLVIAYVDLRGRPAIYTGAEELIAEQLRWFFTNPQILVLAVPVLGIASDIFQGSARGRQRNYATMLAGMALFGLLAFGADMQSFFDRSGTDVTSEFMYLAGGIAIVLPFLMLSGGWADTIIGGRRNLSPPSAAFIVGLVALDLVAAAVIASFLRAIEPLDLIGTSADQGAALLALAAAFGGGWAGWVWWSPKFTGRHVPAGAPLLVSSLLLIGGAVAGVAWVVAGFFDPGESVLETLSVVAMLGLAVFAVAIVAAWAIMMSQMVAIGARAEDNPWNASTLEWSGPTPPPEGNFAEPVGVVASAQPLLDTDDDVEDS